MVELKQWSAAQADPEDPELVYVDAYGRRPVLHPARQVQNYVDYMADFIKALANNPESVRGPPTCTTRRRPRSHLCGDERRPRTADSSPANSVARGWSTWLPRWVRPGRARRRPPAEFRGRPSRQLMKVAADEIQQREQFTLLDEQEVAYRLVLNAVKSASRADHKSVIVVTGGPGSGRA